MFETVTIPRDSSTSLWCRSILSRSQSIWVEPNTSRASKNNRQYSRKQLFLNRMIRSLRSYSVSTAKTIRPEHENIRLEANAWRKSEIGVSRRREGKSILVNTSHTTDSNGSSAFSNECLLLRWLVFETYRWSAENDQCDWDKCTSDFFLDNPLTCHSIQIDFQRSLRDNHIVFTDPADPDLEQCRCLFAQFDWPLISSSLVRQDLIQLNAKLRQQAEYANDLLIQCGIDSSYALTQVNG